MPTRTESAMSERVKDPTKRIIRAAIGRKPSHIMPAMHCRRRYSAQPSANRLSRSIDSLAALIRGPCLCEVPYGSKADHLLHCCSPNMRAVPSRQPETEGGSNSPPRNSIDCRYLDDVSEPTRTKRTAVSSSSKKALMSASARLLVCLPAFGLAQRRRAPI
jgi:hypothetical protein